MGSKTLIIMNTFVTVCTVNIACYIIIIIVRFFYNNFLVLVLKIHAVDLTKSGKWAVVTGATDGIGKAYAEALAKKNLNIVLISRTQAKLDNVKADIQMKYNIEIKTIAADFTSASDIYKIIEKHLQGLDIGILINNVGMFYPYPEYFLNLENKDEVYDNMIRCNISSVVNMCKVVLPGMMERKRGIIVNISSASAIVPCPLLCVYSGSKAFVKKFSEDLSSEYKKNGIIVQCLVPSYVSTNMIRTKKLTWMVPSAAKYVENAITTIGVREVTTGYFPQTLLIEGINYLDLMFPRLAKWLVMRNHLRMKFKALKRQQLIDPL